MPNYNLLQWRDMLRYQQCQMLKITLCFAVVLGLVVSILWGIFIHQKINRVTTTLLTLQQEFMQLQQQEKEQENIQQKILVLQQQDNFVRQIENTMLHNIELLITLSRATSSVIFLNSLRQTDGFITLTGNTFSLKAFANFMRKLSQLSWLCSPVLQEISNNNANNLQDNFFVLQIASRKRLI